MAQPQGGRVEALAAGDGSRYAFIVLYVLLERHLSRGDYRRTEATRRGRGSARNAQAPRRGDDVAQWGRRDARSASRCSRSHTCSRRRSRKAFEMDEGAVNAYAARILDGAVPHRDFLTFYGPGNLWLVAGAFEVFGESVGVERAVGDAVSRSSSSSRCSSSAGGSADLSPASRPASWRRRSWRRSSSGRTPRTARSRSGSSGSRCWRRRPRRAPSRRTGIAVAAAGVAAGLPCWSGSTSRPPSCSRRFRCWRSLRAGRGVRFAAGFLAALAVFAVHLASSGPSASVGRRGSPRSRARSLPAAADDLGLPGSLLAVANSLGGIARRSAGRF